MSWPRVLLFAVVTAVYTGIVCLIPPLKNTSLSDIGVTLECWILFALLIITNCKTRLEASLKCFVFFLVSQPLIYLVQAPFVGWEIFRYYPRWFFITLLTFPGAAVAFLVKKQNWPGTLVLCAATVYLGWQGVWYFRSALDRFPFHLLSALFCFALAITLILLLLDGKKHRIAALTVTAALTLGFAAVGAVLNGGAQSVLTLPEGEWTASVEDSQVLSVVMEDGSRAVLTSLKNGATYVSFENADGEILTYSVVANRQNLQIGTVD